MTILLVDDSAFQRTALSAVLRQEGHKSILMAGSAADAFEQLGRETPDSIDLILMDLEMPDANGIEATRRIKSMEAWHDVPVIMITGSDDRENLKLAFAAGAMDYITKPPNEVELMARVRSALRLKHETDKRKAREAELQQLNARLSQMNLDLARQHSLLQAEQAKAERLLLNILPKPIADRLKQDQGVIADSCADVTVLFVDIVDFTTLSSCVSAQELVTMLNRVFTVFDQLADKHGLEKIKTSGDAYMVAGGLPLPKADHAEAVAEMALDCRRELEKLTGGTMHARLGIHTGALVAGVIGTKKFIYDVWGDTVNIASRMQAHSQPDRIQVSKETHTRLHDRYQFTPLGKVLIKGKGEMETCFLLGRKP